MTTKPTRHQRSRAKGSRLPDGVVCVTRPGKWGNPYPTRFDFHVAIKEILEGRMLTNERQKHYEHMHRIAISLHELTGKDLACWCKIGKDCHAADLLMMANDKNWLAASERLRNEKT